MPTVECDCCRDAATEVGWRCCSTPATRELESISCLPRPKVENPIRFAVAVYGLRCPEKLPSPVSSSIWVPEYFRGVGGFPLPIHPGCSLPSWAPPKPLDWLKRQHFWSSYTQKGRRLENSRLSESFEAVLTRGERILQGFTLADQVGKLQSNISKLAPIQFFKEKVIKFWKYILQRFLLSRMKNQDRKSGTL